MYPAPCASQGVFEVLLYATRLAYSNSPCYGDLKTEFVPLYELVKKIFE